MATGIISWSQTAASNATADSAVNMAEGMAPSAVNDGIRALMASAAKYRDDISGALLTAGSSTAYTLTTNQTFASLSAMSGHTVVFEMDETSGASPTLNVDSLGAKALKSVSGTTLPTGYLLQGGIYAATYSNADNEWVVHGVPGSLGTLAALAVTALTIGTSITPTSSDGSALGSGSLMFSDLFLASGGVINFNNGDVTATHSANALAFAGASSGYTFDAAVTVTGALAASGDFAIATNKFTVASASGNTAVAGTLAVTGATTLTGALTASNAAGITAENTIKARVCFQGDGTVSINSSFNVTSVTDNGVGDYTINFTNALPDANYALVGSTQSISLTNAQGVVNIAASSATGAPSTKTTTACRIIVGTASSGVPTDYRTVSVVVI